MRTSTKVGLAVNLAMRIGIVFAQIPSEVAENLKTICPVVNPSATAPLYAARIAEKELFAAAQIERDIAYGKN
jgi:hypothetical protein